MSVLQVFCDYTELRQRVNEGQHKEWRRLKVMECYYSDRHEPPGFYIKISTRAARLVTPINVISLEAQYALVSEAANIRPSPGDHVYDLTAKIVVTSALGGAS